MFSGIDPQNTPIEQIFGVCGTGSRKNKRGTFEVGERKLLSVPAALPTTLNWRMTSGIGRPDLFMR